MIPEINTLKGVQELIYNNNKILSKNDREHLENIH